MKIEVGTCVWVVIDDEGQIRGVWNSLRHAEKQCQRLNIDIDNKDNYHRHIKRSQYLGGV